MSKRVDLGPLKASHPPQTFTIEDDPFKGACLHAARTGDASGIIRLLREHHPLDEWDRDMLADLLESRATFKRPKGNPRPKDKWVALAVAVARWDKQNLYRLGWKKGKGRRSIDDIAVGTAIGYMQHCEYPVLPDVETFKARVITELHKSKSRRPKSRQ